MVTKNKRHNFIIIIILNNISTYFRCFFLMMYANVFVHCVLILGRCSNICASNFECSGSDYVKGWKWEIDIVWVMESFIRSTKSCLYPECDLILNVIKNKGLQWIISSLQKFVAKPNLLFFFHFLYVIRCVTLFRILKSHRKLKEVRVKFNKYTAYIWIKVPFYSWIHISQLIPYAYSMSSAKEQ